MKLIFDLQRFKGGGSQTTKYEPTEYELEAQKEALAYMKARMPFADDLGEFAETLLKNHLPEITALNERFMGLNEQAQQRQNTALNGIEQVPERIDDAVSQAIRWGACLGSTPTLPTPLMIRVKFWRILFRAKH